MRDSVTGEGDMVGLKEAGSEQVAKSVIFLVKGEKRRGGDTWPRDWSSDSVEQQDDKTHECRRSR